jgi:hypothetical protein
MAVMCEMLSLIIKKFQWGLAKQVQPLGTSRATAVQLEVFWPINVTFIM